MAELSVAVVGLCHSEVTAFMWGKVTDHPTYYGGREESSAVGMVCLCFVLYPLQSAVL